MSSIVDLAYIIELENGTKLSNRKISSEYNCCVKTIAYISNEFEATGDFQAEIDTADLLDLFGDVFGLEGKGFTLIMADIFGGVANMKTSYIGSGTIYTPTGGVKISDTITLGFRFLPKNMLQEVSPYTITMDDFPDVADEYLGQPIPVLVGDIKNHECIPLQKKVSGTLYGDIDLADTSIECFISLEDFPASGYVIIDDEVINYQSISNNSSYQILNNCVRGCYSTIAAPHTAGTSIDYRYASYQYLIGYAPSLTNIESFVDGYKQSLTHSESNGIHIISSSIPLQYKAYGSIQTMTVKDNLQQYLGSNWISLDSTINIAAQLSGYPSETHIRMANVSVPGQIAKLFFSYDYTHSVEIPESYTGTLNEAHIATLDSNLQCTLATIKNFGTGQTETEIMELPEMSASERKDAIGSAQTETHSHQMVQSTSLTGIESVDGPTGYRYTFSNGSSTNTFYHDYTPTFSTSYKIMGSERTLESTETVSVNWLKIEIPVTGTTDEGPVLGYNWWQKMSETGDAPFQDDDNGFSKNQIKIKVRILSPSGTLWSEKYYSFTGSGTINMQFDSYATAGSNAIPGWSANPTLSYFNGATIELSAATYQFACANVEPATDRFYFFGTMELDVGLINFIADYSGSVTTDSVSLNVQSVTDLPTKPIERDLYPDSNFEINNSQVTACARFKLYTQYPSSTQQKLRVQLSNPSFRIQYYPLETNRGDTLTVNASAPYQTALSVTNYLLNLHSIPGYSCSVDSVDPASKTIRITGNKEQIFFPDNQCQVLCYELDPIPVDVYTMTDIAYDQANNQTVITVAETVSAITAESWTIGINPANFIADHFEDGERPKLKDMFLAGALTGRIWDVLKEIATQTCHELTYTSGVLFMPIHEKLTETFAVDYQVNHLAKEREIIKRGPVDDVINQVYINGHTGSLLAQDDLSIEKYGTYNKTLDFYLIDARHIDYIAKFYLLGKASPKTYIEWKEASESFRLGRTFQFPDLDYINKGAIVRVIRQTNSKAITKYLGQIITFTLTLFEGSNWMVVKTINSIDFFYQGVLKLQLKDGNLRVIGDIVQTEDLALISRKGVLFDYTGQYFVEDPANNKLLFCVPLDPRKTDGSTKCYALMSLSPNGDLYHNVSTENVSGGCGNMVFSSDFINDHQLWNLDECPKDGIAQIYSYIDDAEHPAMEAKVLFGTNPFADLMLYTSFLSGYEFQVLLRGSLIQIDAF